MRSETVRVALRGCAETYSHCALEVFVSSLARFTPHAGNIRAEGPLHQEFNYQR